MWAEHVVMEAENTVVAGAGRVLAALVGGLEDSAQQHGCVFELLGDWGLDVEVVAIAGAQCVVLPGPRVQGWSGASDAGPVKHISSTLLLLPAAQSVFKVTLQLWSCETWQEMNEHWWWKTSFWDICTLLDHFHFLPLISWTPLHFSGKYFYSTTNIWQLLITYQIRFYKQSIWDYEICTV